MQILSSDAIILRHLDYGEADRIVTFLTPGHGRLKGFARGARKSRRRFGTSLEPFARVRLQWTPPRRGELVSLREADLLDLRAGLRSDLAALTLAGYGCELADELLGEAHGNPEGYALVDAFLDFLAAGGEPLTARLLFELRLLLISGYIPHLLHCAECGGPLPEPETAFAAARGGSLCTRCARGAAGRISLLTLGTLSRSLQTPVTRFAGFRLSARTLAEGERVLAPALAIHLQRPPRSLSLLEQLLPEPEAATGE